MTKIDESTSQIHAHANDYRDLCNLAGDVLKHRPVKLPKGYEVLDTKRDKFNFKSVVYKNNDEIIICYLGTEKFSIKDHSTNLKMYLSGEPTKQMELALKLCDKIVKDNPSSKVRVIGHSEGGSEALYVGLSKNLPTVTFNAYGLNPKLVENLNNDNIDKLVVNYRDPNDPVSKLRTPQGKSYIVDSSHKYLTEKINPFGNLSAHKISNFGDCNNAIPLEKYKNENKSFIDNIVDVEITDKDIANMSSDLYNIYDEEISSRLAKGKILKESQAQVLAFNGNLIKVSLYTRADGIWIRGYYRRLQQFKFNRKAGGCYTAASFFFI